MSGYTRLIAVRSGQVGQFYAKLGQLTRAQVMLEDAVRDLQALGIRANEPMPPLNLRRLADVFYQQGDYVRAETCCHTALRILQEYGQSMFDAHRLTLETMHILTCCQQAQGHSPAGSGSTCK